MSLAVGIHVSDALVQVRVQNHHCQCPVFVDTLDFLHVFQHFVFVSINTRVIDMWCRAECCRVITAWCVLTADGSDGIDIKIIP